MSSSRNLNSASASAPNILRSGVCSRGEDPTHSSEYRHQTYCKTSDPESFPSKKFKDQIDAASGAFARLTSAPVYNLDAMQW